MRAESNGKVVIIARWLAHCCCDVNQCMQRLTHPSVLSSCPSTPPGGRAVHEGRERRQGGGHCQVARPLPPPLPHPSPLLGTFRLSHLPHLPHLPHQPHLSQMSHLSRLDLSPTYSTNLTCLPPQVLHRPMRFTGAILGAERLLLGVTGYSGSLRRDVVVRTETAYNEVFRYFLVSIKSMWHSKHQAAGAKPHGLQWQHEARGGLWRLFVHLGPPSKPLPCMHAYPVCVHLPPFEPHPCLQILFAVRLGREAARAFSLCGFFVVRNALHVSPLHCKLHVNLLFQSISCLALHAPLVHLMYPRVLLCIPVFPCASPYHPFAYLCIPVVFSSPSQLERVEVGTRGAILCQGGTGEEDEEEEEGEGEEDEDDEGSGDDSEAGWDPETHGGGKGGDDEEDHEMDGLEPEEVEEGVGEGGGGAATEAASQHVAEGGGSVGVKVGRKRASIAGPKRRKRANKLRE
ncbi:unnamed protein product [Closterium sp. NIES-54]